MATLFVSGGARGIGEAIVRLAAGKYNVCFTYCGSEERARALERELDRKYGGVLAVKCDVRSAGSVEEAVAAAKKRFKRVDALINNAGISRSGLLLDCTDDEWREVFAVNTDGAFRLTRALLPDIIASKGAIVNISSVWGALGGSCEVAYSASKGAIDSFTKALAKELAPMGVRVNAVAPGAIDTDMMKQYSDEERAALVERSIPLGRLGTAQEVAEAALFLVESKYISGAILPVDGLFTA